MEPTRQEPIRILIVEDEGVTALDTSEQLELLGYRVVGTAFSAAEAIAKTADLAPDLVLMDIRLKGAVDGISAASTIRTRFDVPAVFLTAYADDATVQRAKRAEPFGYILKPFDERELRVTIEMAIYKHHVERQRSDLLAMLSHDIRNPLGVILTYTEMLGDELQQDNRAQAEDLLRQITTTALSVHALVTNYLDLSRIESGQLALRREPVQLNDVAAGICAQYEAGARQRGVRLELALAESLAPVHADRVAAERIFTNLVYNALKFTPANGTVRVTSAARGREIAVAVADTGAGIAAEHLPHLFDRYRNAASPQDGGGTGLGLFIVKTLVDAHGGRVEVASTPGRGTCFSVSLPVAEPAA